MLIGTLNSEAEEATARKVALVFLHQVAAGVHDGRFAVELLNRALVSALGRTQVEERMAGLLMDDGDIDGTPLNCENLEDLFHIVAVHGVDGANAIVTHQIPGFPVRQMIPARAQCPADHMTGVGSVCKVIGKGLGCFREQPLNTLMTHVLHERHDGFFGIEERRQPGPVKLFPRIHDRTLAQPAGEHVQTGALGSLYHSVSNLEAVLCQTWRIHHQNVCHFRILGKNLDRPPIQIRGSIVVEIDRVLAGPVRWQQIGQGLDTGIRQLRQLAAQVRQAVHGQHPRANPVGHDRQAFPAQWPHPG